MLVAVVDAHDTGHGGLIRMVNVHVRNHSQSPILDVGVHVIRRGCDPAAASVEDTLTFRAESIDPGESDSELWLPLVPIRRSHDVPLAESLIRVLHLLMLLDCAGHARVAMGLQRQLPGYSSPSPLSERGVLRIGSLFERRLDDWDGLRHVE